MRLPLFLISSAIGAGVVLLKEHLHNLTKQATETKGQIQQAKHSVATIQNKLASIQKEKDNITNISHDLAYKLRVFNQETQAHLAEIQKITDKYKEHD